MAGIEKPLRHAWLITRRQLAEALRLRAAGGGRFGPVSDSVPDPVQPHVDPSGVTPILERALDDGPDAPPRPRSIHYQFLRRLRSRSEDVLDPHAPSHESAVLEGQAVIEAAGRRSAPFRFVVDEAVGTARIDDDARERLRAWIRSIEPDAQAA